jgi:hypothetical protein
METIRRIHSERTKAFFSFIKFYMRCKRKRVVSWGGKFYLGEEVGTTTATTSATSTTATTYKSIKILPTLVFDRLNFLSLKFKAVSKKTSTTIIVIDIST